MNVMSIRPNVINISRLNQINKTSTSYNKDFTPIAPHKYQYPISFGAITVNQALESESGLYNKYLQAGEPDILEFLNNNPTTPTSVFKFLCHATGNNKTSKKVAEQFSKDPRQAESIKEKLIESMGGNKEGTDLFMTWFHDENNGYRNAYANYYNNEIWNKASDLTQLVKQSPNITPWALQKKATELGQEVVFGELPKEFGTYETYSDLIAQIKESEFHKSYIKAKDAEFQKKDEDSMKAADESNRIMHNLAKPFQITTEAGTFTIKPVIQSFSAKSIYFITPDADKSKNYIIKFDPYEINEETDKARKLTESSAIRPDMPYLDAMVDFYLKENNSPNAPDIEFYDYNTKSVIYKATEGKEPIIPEEYANNLYSFVNYDKVKDLKDLGIGLNDVHAGNFKETANGDYKLIDSGHVSYSNTFRPPVISRHLILGNLCGRELCK